MIHLKHGLRLVNTSPGKPRWSCSSPPSWRWEPWSCPWRRRWCGCRSCWEGRARRCWRSSSYLPWESGKLEQQRNKTTPFQRRRFFRGLIERLGDKVWLKNGAEMRQPQQQQQQHQQQQLQQRLQQQQQLHRKEKKWKMRGRDFLKETAEIGLWDRFN